MKILTIISLLLSINVYSACGDSDSNSGINTLVTDGCLSTNELDRTIIINRNIIVDEEIKSDAINLKFQALNEEINALEEIPITIYYVLASKDGGGSEFLEVKPGNFSSTTIFRAGKTVYPVIEPVIVNGVSLIGVWRVDGTNFLEPFGSGCAIGVVFNDGVNDGVSGAALINDQQQNYVGSDCLDISNSLLQ